MAEVVTLVTGRIPPDRLADLEQAYRELVQDGPPPPIEDTFLLRIADDQVGILTLWHRRADVDAMLATGEEPPARRLIRTHGGEPQVTFGQILVRASSL